ncbi:MAG: hypothetical protein AAGC77_05940 [Pseudomonadota bacterium]
MNIGIVAPFGGWLWPSVLSASIAVLRAINEQDGITINGSRF